MTISFITILLAITTNPRLQAGDNLTLSSLAPSKNDSPALESSVASSFMDLNGIRYIKLRSKDGAIYLPAVEHFSPDQLRQLFLCEQHQQKYRQNKPSRSDHQSRSRFAKRSTALHRAC